MQRGKNVIPTFSGDERSQWLRRHDCSYCCSYYYLIKAFCDDLQVIYRHAFARQAIVILHVRSTAEKSAVDSIQQCTRVMFCDFVFVHSCSYIILQCLTRVHVRRLVPCYRITSVTMISCLVCCQVELTAHHLMINYRLSGSPATTPSRRHILFYLLRVLGRPTYVARP